MQNYLSLFIVEFSMLIHIIFNVKNLNYFLDYKKVFSNIRLLLYIYK